MGQRRLEREAQPAFEIGQRAALIVHPHQIAEVFAAQLAAKRLRRHRPDNRPGARLFFRIARRAALEDLPPARCFGHARYVERTRDGDILQVRSGRDAEARAVPRIDERVVDGREQVVERPGLPRRKRHRDMLRARPDVNGRRHQHEPARVGIAHARMHFKDRHAIAIDRHLDGFLVVGQRDRRVAEQLAADRAHELGGETVGAIGREHVCDGEAAA